MNKKIKRILLCVLLVMVLSVILSVNVFAAGEDLFQVADKIIRDVYNKIAGISTILAGLMSAVSVIGLKFASSQQKSDQCWDWLKRIWIAWAIINGIGAFIAYITPLFAGYNKLP